MHFGRNPYVWPLRSRLAPPGMRQDPTLVLPVGPKGPGKGCPVLGARTVLLLAVLLLTGCLGRQAIPPTAVRPNMLDAPKSKQKPINFLRLRREPVPVYLLGPRDILGVYIEGVLGTAEEAPPVHFPESDKWNRPPALGFPIPIREDGTVSLPLVPPLPVSGLSLPQAEQMIRKAYTVDRKILQPGRDRIIVTLIRPREYQVLVVREDATRGPPQQLREGTIISSSQKGEVYVVNLPAYENDVLHALAESGGLPGLDAKNEITILRGSAIRDKDGAFFSAFLEDPHRFINELERRQRTGPRLRGQSPETSYFVSDHSSAQAYFPSAGPRPSEQGTPPVSSQIAKPTGNARSQPEVAAYFHGQPVPGKPAEFTAPAYRGPKDDPVAGQPARAGTVASSAQASFRQHPANPSNPSAPAGSPPGDSRPSEPTRFRSDHLETPPLSVYPTLPRWLEPSKFAQATPQGRFMEGASALNDPPGAAVARPLRGRAVGPTTTPVHPRPNGALASDVGDSPSVFFPADQPAVAARLGNSPSGNVEGGRPGDSPARALRENASGSPEKKAAKDGPSNAAAGRARVTQRRPRHLAAGGNGQPAGRERHKQEASPPRPDLDRQREAAEEKAPRSQVPHTAQQGPPDAIQWAPRHPESTIDQMKANVVRIPLRVSPGDTLDYLSEEDIILGEGDIIFVESRDAEVFYTGGLLTGGQFPIPRDYDLDVLGAIAMAGGESYRGGSSYQLAAGVGAPTAGRGGIMLPPTKVTVLRMVNGRQQVIQTTTRRMLRDPSSRILVQPNDFILLEYTGLEFFANFFLGNLQFNYFLNNLGR